MSDNVTPFRPRRAPNPPPGSTGPGWKTPRGLALIGHGLTLATFMTYFFGSGAVDYVALGLGVAALAIAASRREEGMPWARTHHEFTLRTLIGGGAIWLLALLSSAIPGVGAYASYGLLAVLIWVAVRSIVGAVRAVLRRPIPSPTTPLF